MLPYQPCSTVEALTTFGPKLATASLRDVTRLVLNYRGFHLGDDGIFNHRLQRGSSSLWSLHAGGRAWDCAIEAAHTNEGDFVAQLMVDKADLIGVCEVIWNRHRWSLQNGVLYKAVYTGIDPHITHVHVGQTRDFVAKPASQDAWNRWYSHFLFGL